jgi:N-6 DNA Methylase
VNALETYLRELHAIHVTGEAVAETSYYPVVEGLLNTVGGQLKPAVRCVIHPKDRGAGIPDGGLFVPRQLTPATTANANLLLATAPERGVVEVKPPTSNVKDVARTRQVRRYLERYGKVLVINLREFLLVGTDQQGGLKLLESLRLANSDETLWALAAEPASFAAEQNDRLVGFLRRVLEHGAPLASPQDLAWFLAAYAREALARIHDRQLPALAMVREALEDALGLEFEGVRGERFFRSTLVQTLFYGLFSAWVLWSRDQPTDSTEQFKWKQAAWSLNVPMVRVLFEQIATPSQLGPLKLAELMDWTEQVLNRVDRERFFTRFEEARAVQYFYEPFLKEFDPELQRQLGVWYTPSEVVQYMVARIDQVLRDDFGLSDGFADECVYVLDPCTGTGSYLVEVLNRIAKTVAERGDALVAHDVKKAATTRIFGFELLPAPFVVAHLQLGLFLARLGVPLDQGMGERAGVYLTNSLTGWDDGSPGTPIPFPELQEERDAAEHVKRDPPILVILGNPPYNGFAGVSPAEEHGLVDPYKSGLAATWGITKNFLDDLYIRFYRIAERRITEGTGKGVVCYISNFSFLGDPSCVEMRLQLLREFDAITIDCLNGDSRETGKVTPDGKPDPSVFSTPYNRAGIQVGTAITMLVRKEDHQGPATVRFRDFWGVTKRADLLQGLAAPAVTPYLSVTPTRETRFSLRPTSALASIFRVGAERAGVR